LHIYAAGDSEQNYIHSIYKHSPALGEEIVETAENVVLLPHNHVVYFVLLKKSELHEIVHIPILSLPIFTCCKWKNLRGIIHLEGHVDGSDLSICAEIPTNWSFTDSIQIPTSAFFKPSRPKQANWHIFRKQRFPLKWKYTNNIKLH
jgi:hypothetical protein